MLKKTLSLVALLAMACMAMAQSSIPLTRLDNGNWTFTMPAHNLSMSAEVYSTNDPNGYTIDGIPDGWQIQALGETVTVTDGVTTPLTAGMTVTIVPPDSLKNRIKSLKLSYIGAPEGAINGKFTVSTGGDQVYFSKGNLKYDGSAWSFFDNQYDYLATRDGTNWDLFGWSTSATTYGMSTSQSNDDYSGLFKDWGATMGTGWRTLTSDEWTYLFNTRSASTVGGTENARYAKAKVNNVQGVILFPDTYTHPSDVTAPTGINATGNTGWNGNTYDATAWAKMEVAGCVFLPAAGQRSGSSVIGAGSNGNYWSRTLRSTESAYYVYFYSGVLNPANNYGRYYGYSVRLVCAAEAAGGQGEEQTGPTVHTLAESTVGMIVGSDGKAYAAADKDNLPSGVTAVAMVAYKSATAGSSLAIALSDEGSMNWETAISICEGKAAIGGNKWKLPSQDEWKQMFSANGGNDASYTGLNTAITSAGGTALQDDTEYWSSSEYDGDDVWDMYLDGAYAVWGHDDKDYGYLVRACLAF